MRKNIDAINKTQFYPAPMPPPMKGTYTPIPKPEVMKYKYSYGRVSGKAVVIFAILWIVLLIVMTVYKSSDLSFGDFLGGWIILLFVGIFFFSLLSKIILGFVNTSKMNQKATNDWQNKDIEYRKQWKIYEQNFDAAIQNYYRDSSIYDTAKRNWLIQKATDIKALTVGKNQAEQKLQELYISERLLPKPYQNAESVWYLYDFLSTASDDYDIKYALERVDFNDMKRLMGQMIVNQARQIVLETIANAQRESIQSDINFYMNDAANTLQNHASAAKSYYKDSLAFLAGAERYMNKIKY